MCTAPVMTPDVNPHPLCDDPRSKSVYSEHDMRAVLWVGRYKSNRLVDTFAS